MVKAPEELLEALRLGSSIVKSVKVMSMYPETHPSLKANIKKNFDVILSILQKKNKSQIEISRKKVVIDEIPLPEEDEVTEGLIEIFFWRRIGSVTIFKNVSDDEFFHFCKILTQPRENFEREDYVEEYLLSNNIEHIWVNNISFDALKEKYKKAGSFLDTSNINEFLRQIKEEKLSPGIILQAIKLLSTINDPNEYYNLLKKIVGMVRKADLSDNALCEAIVELVRFLSLNYTNQLVHPLIRKFSGEALRSLADERVINKILDMVVSLPARKAIPLINVLSAVGSPVIKPAIKKILETNEDHHLSNLAKVITVLGEEGERSLIYYLKASERDVILKVMKVLSYMETVTDVKEVAKFIHSTDREIRILAHKIILEHGGREYLSMFMKTLRSAPESELILFFSHMINSGKAHLLREIEDEMEKMLKEKKSMELKKLIVEYFTISQTPFAVEVLTSILLKEAPFKKILPEDFVDGLKELLFNELNEQKIKILYMLMVKGKGEISKFASIKLGAFSEFYL